LLVVVVDQVDQSRLLPLRVSAVMVVELMGTILLLVVAQ
jgi:hypothetical protein